MQNQDQNNQKSQRTTPFHECPIDLKHVVIILVFMVGQTIAATWWASSLNTTVYADRDAIITLQNKIDSIMNLNLDRTIAVETLRQDSTSTRQALEKWITKSEDILRTLTSDIKTNQQKVDERLASLEARLTKIEGKLTNE